MSSFPNGWSQVTLGQLGRYINGMAFKPTEWGEEGLPIIRIQNLNDPTKPFNFYRGKAPAKYFVQDGDLLISWSASLGAFIWDRGDAWLNQHIFRVEPNEELVRKDFLYYLVSHLLDEIGEHTHGSTMKHITKGKFEALPVGIPNSDEQLRIATRINECMARIDEIEGLRSQTKKMAATLELAAFHDALIAGINQHGWPMGTLGEVALSFRYGTSSKAHSDEIGTPVLRMGNIVNGYFDYGNLKYIELQERELNKYRLKMGDILINRTNSLELVGKAAMFDREDGEWAYASYLVCVDVDRSRVMPEFATAVINSRMGRDFVAATARRAIGMVNINAKEMARFPMPLPSLKDQEAIVELLRTVRSSAKNLRSDLEEPGVGHLRSAVLRKAFAGEL